MSETIQQAQPVDLDTLPLFVTFAEAGALLGGSKPYSTKTIQRRVAADHLQAVGERRGRRIVGKSLRRLISEFRGGKTPMARKRKQRGEYGAGSTYQNKKGEWFGAFPLGKG